MKGDDPHEETGFGVCLFFLKHKYQIWSQKGNVLCEGALSISLTHAGQVEGVTSPAAHSSFPTLTFLCSIKWSLVYFCKQ